jgi:hypothetical protein
VSTARAFLRSVTVVSLLIVALGAQTSAPVAFTEACSISTEQASHILTPTPLPSTETPAQHAARVSSEVHDATNAADTIFVGRAIRTEIFDATGMGPYTTWQATRATFSVSQIWKGAVPPEAIVEERPPPAPVLVSCGADTRRIGPEYWFVPTGDYLVYARYETTTQQLVFMPRTIALGSASEDLAVLGQASAMPVTPVPTDTTNAPLHEAHRWFPWVMAPPTAIVTAMLLAGITMARKRHRA